MPSSYIPQRSTRSFWSQSTSGCRRIDTYGRSVTHAAAASREPSDRNRSRIGFVGENPCSWWPPDNNTPSAPSSVRCEVAAPAGQALHQRHQLVVARRDRRHPHLVAAHQPQADVVAAVDEDVGHLRAGQVLVQPRKRREQASRRPPRSPRPPRPASGRARPAAPPTATAPSAPGAGSTGPSPPGPRPSSAPGPRSPGVRPPPPPRCGRCAGARPPAARGSPHAPPTVEPITGRAWPCRRRHLRHQTVEDDRGRAGQPRPPAPAPLAPGPHSW